LEQSFVFALYQHDYYSRKQIKDAAFGSSDGQYLSRRRMPVDHTPRLRHSRAMARWQENNWRGNRLVTTKGRKDERRWRCAEPALQRQIKQKGKESTTPVYASAGSLAAIVERLLQYRTALISDRARTG
jgi:hypothetical protein